MNLDNNILAVVEPAIMPTAIEIEGHGESNESGGADRQTKAIGVDLPFVLLNNYQFMQKDIQSFSLDNSGFLPEMRIRLVDRKNTFGVDSFPRDGDVITILLNSKNSSTFKSIHMDFDITSITSKQASEGDFNAITVVGTAKVPRLYSEECRSFEAAGSLDHLEEVARDLQLGLATNIENTDDTQIRIQAYTSTLDFIKETVDTSYISEDSFQRFYIDQYYYLTYIDVNKVFNSPNPPIDDLQASFASAIYSTAEDKESPEDNDDIEVPLILTNHRNSKGTNMFIGAFNLVNNANDISTAYGYTRDVVIYDDNSEAGERVQEFTIEALNSEEMMDYEEPLKGRRGEDRYDTHKKHKYIGRQDVGEGDIGNVHPSLNFAKLHQAQNLAEIEKVKLKVSLESFNPSIYKYQKIPILIYEYNKERVAAMLKYNKFLDEQGFSDKFLDIAPALDEEDNDDSKPDQVVNRFLSGFYVIENINYKYNIDKGGIVQEVTLIRREWPGGFTNYVE